LIAVNLVPLWGVWFKGWSATELFIVYCMESIILGGYNILMMLLATAYQKRYGINQKPQEAGGMQGYWLILFFIVHYGFFIFIQLSIFLGVSGIDNESSFGAFGFVAHVRDYLSIQMQWMLLLFIASYGLVLLKDFVFSGTYKSAVVENLVFAPYARIFVQQFCVILGGMFLGFGAGKVFVLIFVVVKLWFENLLDYNKMIKAPVTTAPAK